MPLLNRFAKAPRAWPPPASPEEVAAAVDFPRQRDPVGNGVHTALAVSGAFGLSISTAVASMTMVLLIGYLLLRLPNAWRGLTPLARGPLAWAWLAWFAWACLGGLWTPNLLDWGDSLGGFLAVLLLPAFFLVSRSWRAILGAFIAGAAVQGVAQAVHASVPAWRPEWQPRFDGLATHPGHVALVSSMALLVALAWLREAEGRKARVWLGLGLLGCLASVVLGAGRGSLLGLVAGGATLAIAMTVRFGWGRTGATGLLAVSAVGASLLGLGSIGYGPESVVHVVQETRHAAPDSSIAQRVLWWQASWDAFREHPVAGIGTGATATWFDASPRIAEYAADVPGRDRSFFTAPHPHSVYFLTLAEQGLIGVLLMIGVLGSTLVTAWRTTASRPVACGLLGAIVAWWVAGGFESVNLPARLVAPLMLVSAFACLPRGRDVGLESPAGR
jgi:O-antigen ligase